MPAPKIPFDNVQYFRDRSIETLGGCWLWALRVNWCGYGLISRNGRPIKAHRAAYAATHGPIPDLMTVDHKCFVVSCVNPDHLQLLTRSENSRRQRAALRSVCGRGHQRTEENTYVSRDGRRMCRACARVRWAANSDGPLRSHCINGHEYTPENTGRKSYGHGVYSRKCLTCAAIRSASATNAA